jgi:hypothetical protein
VCREKPGREDEERHMTALIIEATFTSYYTNECESHSDVYAEAGSFQAAALFAQDCEADSGFDYTNHEPDFPGDVKRQTRSYFAVEAAAWYEQEETDRRDREEALMPFGSEWFAEQHERTR